MNKTLTAARQVLGSLLTVRVLQNRILPSWCKCGGDKNFFLTQLLLQEGGVSALKASHSQCPVIKHTVCELSGQIPQVPHVLHAHLHCYSNINWAYLAFLRQTLSTWKYLTAKVIPNNASAIVGEAELYAGEISPTEPVTPIWSFNADHNANLIIYYGHNNGRNVQVLLGKAGTTSSQDINMRTINNFISKGS